MEASEWEDLAVYRRERIEELLAALEAVLPLALNMTEERWYGCEDDPYSDWPKIRQAEAALKAAKYP